MVRNGPDFERIQVKTTTFRKAGTWIVSISNTRKGRVVYAPDEIEQFFVIDGDLNYYLIPFAAVGGMHAISLSAYDAYRIKGPGGLTTNHSD